MFEACGFPAWYIFLTIALPLLLWPH
uniref:Uncharacterized protein n=1 Tax=Anguilla anguilla TaxID=7936 RepID=A0A0E9VEI1_ANGAN